MENLANKLKQNPIFQMSLSSKELFHSNFLAWLFERNIEYARIFFPKIKRIASVKREQNNRDITIWEEIDEKAYVIENKFKSIPEKAQLEKYKNDLKSKFVSGVLTGLKNPQFEDMKDWKFKSFEDISTNIKNVAEKVEVEGFEKDLIKNYAEMIYYLSKFIDSYVKATQESWLSDNNFDIAKELRMHDIISKLKANELCAYLKDSISVNDEIPKTIKRNGLVYNLVIETYYSNANPGLNIWYVQNENPDQLSVIGVQIQGLSYRWMAQINKKLSDNKKEKFFNKYKDYGWFEDYDLKKNPKTIKRHETSARIKYGTYRGSAPKEYTFIYQYWNIEDAKNFKYLEKEIIETLKEAAEIINTKDLNLITD